MFLLAILAKPHFSRQRYCFFRTYASAKRIFLIKSHNLPLFSSPNPLSSPFVCHLFATYLHRNLIGTSSESHRNLIGTSPNDERIIKQLLPRLKQLSFDIIFPYTLQKNRIALAHMRFFYYLCGVIYSIIFTIRTTITILPATMEHKSCPRCGAAFICQHENSAKCQCAGVLLSPATRAYIAEQYPNQCLCRKCLLEFSV